MDTITVAPLLFVAMIVFGIAQLWLSRDKSPEWTPPQWQKAGRFIGVRDGYRFFAKATIVGGVVLLVAYVLAPLVIEFVRRTLT